MGRIERFIMILAIVPGMLFPVAAADSEVPASDSATANLILRPATAANYEIGFSSVEIVDNTTTPGSMPNGIIISTEKDAENNILIENDMITGTNDYEHTWFYWKVLSKDTVTVSIKTDGELSYSRDGAVVSKVPMVVDVLGVDPSNANVFSDLPDGYVFSERGIGGGLDVESYQLRITTGPVSLADISAGLYEGTVTIEIKPDGGL